MQRCLGEIRAERKRCRLNITGVSQREVGKQGRIVELVGAQGKLFVFMKREQSVLEHPGA